VNSNRGEERSHTVRKVDKQAERLIEGTPLLVRVDFVYHTKFSRDFVVLRVRARDSVPALASSRYRASQPEECQIKPAAV